jgi:hypothetical protein
MFDLVLAQLIFLRNKLEEYGKAFLPSNIKKYQNQFFTQKIEPDYKIEHKMTSSESEAAHKCKLRSSDEKHPKFFRKPKEDELSNVEQMLRKYKKVHEPTFIDYMKSLGGIRR